MRKGSDMAIFDAAIPAAGLPPRPWRCGMAAVIEEEGGVKSYWALAHGRSEEHTSEHQSLMSIPYAGFCLKNKKYETRKTSKKHTRSRTEYNMKSAGSQK